jgi:hypothetical protein
MMLIDREERLEDLLVRGKRRTGRYTPQLADDLSDAGELVQHPVGPACTALVRFSRLRVALNTNTVMPGL